MVCFPGLLQLRLFNGLCLDFGTVRELVSELSSRLCCGLLLSCCVECFVDISMPQLVTPRPERVYGTCNRRVAYMH